MKTYHAYQVAPENQDARLFFINRSGKWIWEDEFCNNISVLPRPKHHYTMTDIVQEAYDNLESGYYIDNPDARLNSVSELIKNYDWDLLRQDETLCAVLHALTGQEYRTKEIHGACQDDWSVILYPAAEYTDDDIKIFEIAFFNLGSEWCVSDDDGETGVYCFKYDTEEIRQEIADAICTTPENIVLHRFAGYKRLPQYEII